MSDTPPPAPSEVTAPSVVSTPNPPSDSAPPPAPASASAPLPARSYTSRLGAVRPPPAYAPNSSVPRFIRLLATLLFLGGSISAAVAWFYRSVVVPRLVLALKARIQLFDFHATQYGELARRLRQFGASDACGRLGGHQALDLARRVKERDEATRARGANGEQPVPDDDKDKDKTGGNADGEEKRDAEPQFVAPRLVEPLVTSLASLRTALASSAAPASKAVLGTNPSNLVQPQGQLLRSFVTLNEYLESELQSISSTVTNPYRTYGSSAVTASSTTGGGGAGERKALQEATQGLKAEIRSIKGALLNRRNFVRPEITTAA
ncbi:hypothetical protein JCM11491_005708 [Sporobolomyces phaffii]